MERCESFWTNRMSFDWTVMPVEYEVQTEVVKEHGQWSVYLLIMTPQGIDRRRLETTFFHEAKAHLAADVIRRTAARRRPPRETT